MKILTSVLLVLLLSACGPASVPPPAPLPTAAWEVEIQQFEQADREHPPASDGVLFIGSSSIRLWDSLAEDFPGAAVLNRGFGGSELEDVLRYTHRVVLPYRPRLVLVYAGENDLNNGKTADGVLASFRALVEQIHRELPQARIGFISVKPSPSRWHLEAEMRRTNALVREYSARDPRLLYIDVFAAMLDPEGQPREELFVEDRLHLNKAGYRLWRAVILPHL